MTGIAEQLAGSPVAALVTMFMAGLATSLTPCVYPMIPITAGVIAGAGEGSWGRKGSEGWSRRVGLTLTYVLGLALLYASLGLVAGLTGSLFGTVGSNPWARFVMANLLLLFALAMLDVIPVAAPQRLLAWAGRFAGGSYGGVFAMGATSGLVAAPCGAPAFAAVLTWVGGTGSPVLGFLYLLVFSLGMTAVLVLVGLFSGTLAALPRAGRWMVWIKRAGGVILLGMAEYYFVQMGRVL